MQSMTIEKEEPGFSVADAVVKQYRKEKWLSSGVPTLAMAEWPGSSR
jgi:hypothetical protein